MKKCPNCNSCLKDVSFEYRMYRFCSLCYRVYDAYGKQVTDLRITNSIKQMMGSAV